MRVIDLTGQKFGQWTVLSRTHNIKSKISWYCQCSCGKIYIVEGGRLKNGRSTRCMECRSGNNPWKGYNDGGMTSAWHMLLSNAKKNNRMVGITFEQFISLSVQDCFYCNAHPSLGLQRGSGSTAALNIARNGLDRWDNHIGYCDYNIVPCCTACNFLKGTLHGDDFLKQVYSINN